MRKWGDVVRKIMENRGKFEVVGCEKRSLKPFGLVLARRRGGDGATGGGSARRAARRSAVSSASISRSSAVSALLVGRRSSRGAEAQTFAAASGASPLYAFRASVAFARRASLPPSDLVRVWLFASDAGLRRFLVSGKRSRCRLPLFSFRSPIWASAPRQRPKRQPPKDLSYSVEARCFRARAVTLAHAPTLSVHSDLSLG